MNESIVNKLEDTHDQNLNRVKEFSTMIGKAISEQVDRDNPDELIGKLHELSSLQATATYCLAMANKLYAEKMQRLVEMPAFSSLTATDKKLIFAGRASQEQYYVDLCDRYCRNISYAIESIRSTLSFKKVEYEQSRYQQT